MKLIVFLSFLLLSSVLGLVLLMAFVLDLPPTSIFAIIMTVIFVILFLIALIAAAIALCHTERYRC